MDEQQGEQPNDQDDDQEQESGAAGTGGQAEDEKDEEKDEERERIHQGAEEVDPEPAVTAGLDELTEDEKQREPAGVMPGAGPDEEPGPEERDEKDQAE
jgi:hypothetical protein